MKNYLSLVYIFFVCFTSLFIASCNNESQHFLNSNKEKNELMAHLRFLASDELKGRKVGTHEAKIAARYIAEQFRAGGLQNFNTISDFTQPTNFIIKDKEVSCNNVVGFIEGSNSKLKDEYILLCAHYDHLGVKKMNNPDLDSIYNGARDNAMGTTALIYAAKELSKSQHKRSIIFLATTGEENGMLGSKYFVEHCPVNLKDIVFVLNNDGGGFNDTTLIRIGGKNKIDFPFDFWNITSKYNIECLPYPKDFEYLYEKGDNISFARMEIPSITVSPGCKEIDEEILKYVHKPTDEANDDFDYSYLLKFSMVYVDLAIKLSEIHEIPGWNINSN